MRRVGLVVLASVVLTLLLPADARAAEVKELAGTGGVFNSGYFPVRGPISLRPFNSPGYWVAVEIVPNKTGAPSRIDLAMFRESNQGVPMQLALHQTADGRPGAILAATTVSTQMFPLTKSGFVPVPVTGWPRLQENVRYWISARIDKVNAQVRWLLTNTTATVPGNLSYKSLEEDGSESGWRRDGGAVGIRVFGIPPQATRLTANPLIANVSPPQVFLAPSATLVSLAPTKPLPGKVIEFFTGNAKICQATTNANGVARCGGTDSLVNAARNSGFRATFAGDPVYNPSSSNAGLVR